MIRAYQSKSLESILRDGEHEMWGAPSKGGDWRVISGSLAKEHMPAMLVSFNHQDPLD